MSTSSSSPQGNVSVSSSDPNTSQSAPQTLAESMHKLKINNNTNSPSPSLFSSSSSNTSTSSSSGSKPNLTSPKSDFSSFQERIIAFQESRLGGASNPTSPLEASERKLGESSSISTTINSRNGSNHSLTGSNNSFISNPFASTNDSLQSNHNNQVPNNSNQPSSPPPIRPIQNSAYHNSNINSNYNSAPIIRHSPIHSAPEVPVWKNPSTFIKRPTIVTPQAKARNQAKESLAARRNLKLSGMTLPDFSDSQKTPAQKKIEEIRKQGLAVADLPTSNNHHNNPFSSFEKYIDIKNGSLNFNDKASIHSDGVAFASGKSFKISTNDLKVLGELGSGNYGTVSKALHKPSKVILAMKEVKLELEESKFNQILMELDVLHKCDSPFIVDFFGAFFIEGAVYMCIEYMDGGSLDQVYDGGIDEIPLAYITESVVRGLKELKDSHNIIHRDVKPTNILVNTEGKVKLCDFGVSGNLVASKAKTNIGCQSYMPPERIISRLPDTQYTVQSDVWSLGISLVEVAIGKFPYPEAKNILDQLNSIVDGEPPKIPSSRNFSENANNFIMKCLRKNPEQRSTYAELLDDVWLIQNRAEHFGSNYETVRKDFAEFVKAKVLSSVPVKEQQKEDGFAQLNESIESDLKRKRSLKRNNSQPSSNQ